MLLPIGGGTSLAYNEWLLDDDLRSYKATASAWLPRLSETYLGRPASVPVRASAVTRALYALESFF